MVRRCMSVRVVKMSAGRLVAAATVVLTRGRQGPGSVPNSGGLLPGAAAATRVVGRDGEEGHERGGVRAVDTGATGRPSS